MFSQYNELRPTSGWDLLASLGHPSKFQRLSPLGRVTARHSSSGRQPNFAALNRGRHLYSARRPSRWALAHILVCDRFFCFVLLLYISCDWRRCQCVRFSFFAPSQEIGLGKLGDVYEMTYFVSIVTQNDNSTNQSTDFVPSLVPGPDTHQSTVKTDPNSNLASSFLHPLLDSRWKVRCPRPVTYKHTMPTVIHQHTS